MPVLSQFVFFALFALPIKAFIALRSPATLKSIIRPSNTLEAQSDSAMFALDVDLGESGVAKMKFKPKFKGSSAVVVKYPIPFGLDAQPVPGKDFMCVEVTKDGKGGEKVGDILRFTTSWSMGQIEGSGLLSTVGEHGDYTNFALLCICLK